MGIRGRVGFGGIGEELVAEGITGVQQGNKEDSHVRSSEYDERVIVGEP